MTTLLVAVAGSTVSWSLARAARRYAVADRLRGARPPRPVVPLAVRELLARALDAAGLDLVPEHAVQLWALGGACAGVLGAAAGAPGAAAAVATVAVGAPVALWCARHRRARAVAAAVPAVVDAFAAELRTGGTVPTAVAAVAAADGPLRGDFRRIEARVRLGAPLPVAFAMWARERAAPGVHAVAAACALASEVGGRCAGALDGLAASLRARVALAAELRALCAQARYSALVVGAGPIAYVAASAIVDRTSLHALLSTPAGRACALVGLGLEAIGAWWMRAIVRQAERW